MKRILRLGKLLPLLALLLLCSCSVPEKDPPTPALVENRAVDKVRLPSLTTLPIKDSTTVYASEDPASVTVFYLTIRKGMSADNMDHTFEQVNSVIKLQGMTSFEDIRTQVLLQEGDETGPLPGMLGYGQTQVNGSIRLRGRTSTTAAQKSYRIDLLETAGLWRGQRAIALNKHAFDNTRLRNKLFFDLLRETPDIPSLRTQFVHLYVKDETASPAEVAFTDFGLYTQVELPNKRYLRNHELSLEGALYKANMCEMFRYPESIKYPNDPTYDAAAFGLVLEAKGDGDDEKLIKMLDAVNDYAIPIEQTFEKHFNLDNYLTFFAFNLLLGNADSDAQNYLLYSPVNSDVWYYLCWDGDGSLKFYENNLLGTTLESPWTRGISNYWANVLFQRIMRVGEYRALLTEKIEQLYARITPAHMTEKIDAYRAAIDPYVARLPDSIYLRCTLAEREQILKDLPREMQIHYDNYIASLQNPMPFYMDDVTAADGVLSLSWGEAYDFQEETIRYTMQLCTDWTFEPEKILFEVHDQLAQQASLIIPQPGEYCWRVIATDEQGHTQVAFDQFESSAGMHFGTRHFTIDEEGEVTNLL